MKKKKADCGPLLTKKQRVDFQRVIVDTPKMVRYLTELATRCQQALTADVAIREVAKRQAELKKAFLKQRKR